MKKTELIKLKKLLQQEIIKRNKINTLLSNELIQEFKSLTNLNINELQLNDNWTILEGILNNFKIIESNGILVCTGSYLVCCNIYYQETEYYTKESSFNNPNIEYQIFEDIETRKMYVAYTEKYIKDKIEEQKKYYNMEDITPSEFCYKEYGRYLVNDLIKKYIVLNPYNSSENRNGFNDVQKDFFITAIEKGQPKAKQLVLNKYPKLK